MVNEFIIGLAIVLIFIFFMSLIVNTIDPGVYVESIKTLKDCGLR